MFKMFYPVQYLNSIFDIDYHQLYRENKRGLLFDIDNTLVPFDIESPTAEIMGLFEELKSMGFKICLVSNNNEGRVSLFNKNIGLPYVSKAGKPKFSGINKALSLIGTNESNTVFIGDQVFTDVWCGNRKGIHTILVHPVAQRDEFTVRLKRGLEKWVIKKYLKYTKNLSEGAGKASDS